MSKHEWTDRKNWPGLVGREVEMVLKVGHPTEGKVYCGQLKLSQIDGQRGYVVDAVFATAPEIQSITPLDKDTSEKMKVEDLKEGDKIGPFTVDDVVDSDPMEEVEFKTTAGRTVYIPQHDVQALIDAFGVDRKPQVPSVVEGKARKLSPVQEPWVPVHEEWMGKDTLTMLKENLIWRCTAEDDTLRIASDQGRLYRIPQGSTVLVIEEPS